MKPRNYIDELITLADDRAKMRSLGFDGCMTLICRFARHVPRRALRSDVAPGLERAVMNMLRYALVLRKALLIQRCLEALCHLLDEWSMETPELYCLLSIPANPAPLLSLLADIVESGISTQEFWEMEVWLGGSWLGASPDTSVSHGWNERISPKPFFQDDLTDAYRKDLTNLLRYCASISQETACSICSRMEATWMAMGGEGRSLVTYRDFDRLVREWPALSAEFISADKELKQVRVPYGWDIESVHHSISIRDHPAPTVRVARNHAVKVVLGRKGTFDVDKRVSLSAEWQGVCVDCESEILLPNLGVCQLHAEVIRRKGILRDPSILRVLPEGYKLTIASQ